MKTRLFVSVFMLISVLSSFAQNYAELGAEGEVTIEDQTYRWESSSLTLMINNTANVRNNQWLTWNDGTPLTEDEYLSLKLGELDVSSMYQAIRETFSEEEFNQLKAGKDRIEVGFQVSPEGRVLEVYWYIRLTPRTLALFPARVKVFEDNIKKYVTYVPGVDANRLPSWRSFHQINFGSLSLRYMKKTPEDPYFESEAIE